MARRERPSVKGRDPAYSHTFQTARPNLPNGMPPGVKIPDTDGEPAVEAPSSEVQDVAVAPPSEPKAPEAVAVEQGSATLAEDEKPDEMRDTQPSKAKPTKRGRAKPKPAAQPPATSKAEPAAEAGAGTTRRITIKAAITSAHVEAMKPLVANGLAQRDVMAVAGRRAMKRFDPVPKFVPLPEGDRIALADGYVSSKMVQADLLDGLRQAHDPLRLKSDAAMVRGQFEVLFWSVLDEVIDELRQQKG